MFETKRMQGHERPKIYFKQKTILSPYTIREVKREKIHILRDFLFSGPDRAVKTNDITVYKQKKVYFPALQVTTLQDKQFKNKKMCKNKCFQQLKIPY